MHLRFFRAAVQLFDDVDTAIVAGLILPLALFGLFANGVTVFVIYKSQNLKFVCYTNATCFQVLNAMSSLAFVKAPIGN